MPSSIPQTRRQQKLILNYWYLELEYLFWGVEGEFRGLQILRRFDMVTICHNDGPSRYTWSENKLGVIECNILQQIQPANTFDHQDICMNGWWFKGGSSRFAWELHSPLEVPLHWGRSGRSTCVAVHKCRDHPSLLAHSNGCGVTVPLCCGRDVSWQFIAAREHSQRRCLFGTGSNCWSRLVCYGLVTFVCET